MSNSNKTKLAIHIVALNYFSLFFLALGLTISYKSGNTVSHQVVYFILWLYLVPPAAARVIITIFGKPTGVVDVKSTTHTIWWVLFQLQLVFNRFPFLEEILKIVPGFYALWLNLWGAKVNLFSFWASGVTVMDRYHLAISKGAILGTECMLSGHVLVKKGDGSMLLVVDQLTIEPGALIGVRSLISPGCHIHEHQIVAAQQVLKPYTEIKESKKILLKDIKYK